MRIRKFVLGTFNSNCYVVSCPQTLETLVIDPGEESEEVHSYIKHHHLTPRLVALTHAHIDHLLGTAAMQDRYEVETVMHAGDEPLLKNLPLQAEMFGVNLHQSIPYIDRYVAEGDSLRFGSESVRIFHTPGHSPGSITFYTDTLAFVGDVIFFDSIGRTDLTGGSFDQIRSSIEGKIYTLPDETILYPGHGDETTVKREKEFNPFVGSGSGNISISP